LSLFLNYPGEKSSNLHQIAADKLENHITRIIFNKNETLKVAAQLKITVRLAHHNIRLIREMNNDKYVAVSLIPNSSRYTSSALEHHL